MILANEARQKAQEKIFQHQTDELKKIDLYISEAIMRGEMCCSFGGSISERAKIELKRCGYEVYVGSQYNEGYVSIKW